VVADVVCATAVAIIIGTDAAAGGMKEVSDG